MRIAIVNDMKLAVEALRRVICTVPQYQIAWIAYDGEEAVRKCVSDTPDIILMDLIMPVMDGVDATREIMRKAPCAILVVTATVSGNSSKVFDAMGHGALDAVNTPVLGPAGQAEGASALLGKIATIGKLIGKTGFTKPASVIPAPQTNRKARIPLLAIGASTGGPLIIAKLLSRLPGTFGAAIIIIQHVDQEFAPGLATWLGEQTELPVRLAKEGDTLEIGSVLIAGTNNHLVLTNQLLLAYVEEPKELPYRPSVDVFFRSVAANHRGKGVAMLLTGMGRDGAEGMLALKQAGFHTIAQDKETSIVYGMPKAAAELGAAAEILPAEHLAPVVLRHFDQSNLLRFRRN